METFRVLGKEKLQMSNVLNILLNLTHTFPLNHQS